jgi:LPXTG-motif cell wall-anchored protein
MSVSSGLLASNSTGTNLVAGLIALVVGAAVYAFRRKAQNGVVEP